MKLTKKKDKKNRTLLLITFVIIDIFLIFGIITINNAINKNNLNNRFYHLIDINFISNDYDNKTSTNGKYKVVEKAMNDFFINYSKDAKDVLNKINDDNITSLLSVENYNNENNNLNNKLEFINSSKKEIDEDFNKLYNYSTEEYIDSFIKKRSKDKKVIELFNKYMLSIDAHDHFDDCNSLLKAKQEEIDNILNVSNDIYSFLIANDGKWLVKDNQIQFANNTLKEQYDVAISKVK